MYSLLSQRSTVAAPENQRHQKSILPRKKAIFGDFRLRTGRDLRPIPEVAVEGQTAGFRR
jgi:hypothetical protein